MAGTLEHTDDQIVSALRDTKGMIFLAAQKLGCNPEEVYERARTSEIVNDALQMERGKVLDTAELKLFSAVMSGEAWAIKLTLQSLGRSRGYHDSKPAAQREPLRFEARRPRFDPDASVRFALEAFGAGEADRAEPDVVIPKNDPDHRHVADMGSQSR